MSGILSKSLLWMDVQVERLLLFQTENSRNRNLLITLKFTYQKDLLISKVNLLQEIIKKDLYYLTVIKMLTKSTNEFLV